MNNLPVVKFNLTKSAIIIFLCVLSSLVLIEAASVLSSKTLTKSIKTQKKELKALKSAMKAEKKALKDLVKKKTGVISQMEHIAENLDLIEIYLEKLDITHNSLLLSQKMTSNELEDIQHNITGKHRVIARRVRSLYINGKKGHILLSQVPHENMSFFKRVFFTRKMVAWDNNMVEEAKTEEMLRRNTIVELKNKIKEIGEFKKYKTEEKNTFSREHDQFASNLSRLQNSEEVKRRALKEMEKNARALSKILMVLEKQRKQELARKKKARKLNKKGKFCVPVKGRLVSRFGIQYHKTLRTSTKNLGVEYMGSSGEPVLSAAPGEVVYVDQIPGYGRGIIVYNGSGYYNIYGNLGIIKVKQGEKISGCQEIAEIPLNSSKVKRKVYFEVRKERSPLNPVKWLKSMIN